ncbi:hypothetical protein [Flavobacterium marginilacus]|uniref:hypothetical protein n=1 Tax=Flavobacterium marginilacus TaxID=3003256 RepID=UPI00248ECB19|nr:hypothetical protein [Flavobacterium marginilacus]
MKTLITILLSISILSCERQNHDNNLYNEKLKSENELLKHKNDSLKNELNKANLKESYWFDAEYEGLKLTERGIKKPEQFIINSLQKKPELIPLKPALGGKMEFGNFKILSDEWIIVDYSDGHVEGKTIYSYKLNKNNTLEFKILNTTQPK